MLSVQLHGRNYHADQRGPTIVGLNTVDTMSNVPLMYDTYYFFLD